MDYILVAYHDKELQEYFLDARKDLNNHLESLNQNILNDLSHDCDATSFRRNCLLTKNKTKNYVFYSHGDESSILDANNKCFLDTDTALEDFKVNIFYSVACETAKGSLKEEIIKNSNCFFGYNDVGYIPTGSSVQNDFVDCENFCIKDMISNSGLTKDDYMERTEKYFRQKIDALLAKDYVVEAALLMHNKEAVEIH